MPVSASTHASRIAEVTSSLPVGRQCTVPRHQHHPSVRPYHPSQNNTSPSSKSFRPSLHISPTFPSPPLSHHHKMRQQSQAYGRTVKSTRKQATNTILPLPLLPTQQYICPSVRPSVRPLINAGTQPDSTVSRLYHRLPYTISRYSSRTEIIPNQEYDTFLS